METVVQTLLASLDLGTFYHPRRVDEQVAARKYTGMQQRKPEPDVQPLGSPGAPPNPKPGKPTPFHVPTPDETWLPVAGAAQSGRTGRP